MKRFLVVLAVVASAAIAASAAPSGGAGKARISRVPEPEVVRNIAVTEVTRGMRVKLQLTYSRPIVGMVSAVTEKGLSLDLTDEDNGIPGTFRFPWSQVMVVWEVKAQTPEEIELVQTRRRDHVARIKAEVAARDEKRRAAENADETRETREKEDLTKALDVVLQKDEEERMRALLAEYPPDKWSEDTFREVRENWILRDLQPTPEQARFLKMFDEWKTARNTIAAIDAKEKGKLGEQLLIKFPPSEGWGKPRLDAINAKEAEGAALAEDETEFQKSFDDWAAAVARRAAEATAPKPNVETPAETPVEKPAEPAPEPKPEEVAPEKAPDTPAPEVKPEEKAPDAPAPETKPEEAAPEKAPDAPAPEAKPEEKAPDAPAAP